MRTIRLSERSREKSLHIEAPGCIINVQIGLHDSEGRRVTRVDVNADGWRYAGETPWVCADFPESPEGVGVRVVQCDPPIVGISDPQKG
jgi:hypothetical protein